MDGQLAPLEPLEDPGSRHYFACRLRALRRAYAGLIGLPSLSARRFARTLGLDPARYTRYERGELEPPLAVLVRLRHITGVSLDRLIAGEAAGDDNMIPVHGMDSPDEVILADRLRAVRELGEPDIAKAAELMAVPLEDWKRWEAGATRPPLDKLLEFSIRFQVSVDFLVKGDLHCLHPQMASLLLARYPQFRPRDGDDNPQGSPSSNGADRAPHRAQVDIGRSGLRGVGLRPIR